MRFWQNECQGFTKKDTHTQFYYKKEGMIGIKKRDALTNTTHKTLTKRDFAKFNIGRNFALKFSKKKIKENL